jgi:hypothetical protein
MFEGANALAARLFDRLKRKSFRYWLSAIFVFVLGVAGSQAVYEFLGLDKVRAKYFQYLLDHGPVAAEPGYVSLVLIDDREYWTGPPAGRRPLNREYLAKVVDSLVASNVRVIAIDFDMRLPQPDSMEIPGVYKDETCKLIGAIKNGAAVGKKFVLATPISFDDQQRYRRDTDIYQSNGLCERKAPRTSEQKPCGPDFTAQEKDNISCGYISLARGDLLAIPGPLPTTDKVDLDSFSLAIAKAKKPNVVYGEETRYSHFIRKGDFEKAKASFSTANLLNSKSKFDSHYDIAIVGANWSSLALGRGPAADSHETTIGKVVGALLHANYAEALLTPGRTKQAVPDWVVKVIESLFSVAAALVLAVIPGLWQKVGALFLLLVALFFIQWVVLHGLAVFFDAFFPVFCLGLHSLYERILGMREEKEANI